MRVRVRLYLGVHRVGVREVLGARIRSVYDANHWKNVL